MWVTKNYKGEMQVWYEEKEVLSIDEINSLKEENDKLKNLLNKISEVCQSQFAEFDDEIKNGNYDGKFKWFKSGRSDAGKEVLEIINGNS